MVEKTKNSLYKDVAIILGSVFILAVIGYFIWFPNLLQEIDQSPTFILDMMKSVLIHCYFPFVVCCFVLGEITMNLSQVDKIWSVSPVVFCWYLTIYEAKEYGMTWNYKLVLMSCLVTVWGFRLTYQFYMKGGYSIKFWTGEEDYRWETVRQRLPLLTNRFVFFLFDLFFICIYQLLLLFLISGFVMIATIMVDHAADKLRDSLTASDWIIGTVVLVLIILEALSDYHQQLFQREKYRRIRENKPLHCSTHHYEIGFNTNGLFAYSRHPNFTAEQSIWVIFYLFSVVFTNTKPLLYLGGFFNVASLGMILLIILFLKSTDLTEDISLAKYPLYGEYQKNVHRILDLKLILNKFIFGQNSNREWLKKK